MGTETLGTRQPAAPIEGVPVSNGQPRGPWAGVLDGGGARGGAGGGGADGDAAFRPAVTGAWMLTAAVSMLFVAFTSTYLVRRTGPDWRPGPMPPVLYLNTALLAASSAVLEWARKRARRGQLAALVRGLGWAAVLGTAFLAGQAVAWWQLLGRGVTPAGTPHGSFFYLLTGMHGLHAAAGVGWLSRTWVSSRRARSVAEVHAGVDATAVFWHFIGVLWVYLWVLLFWI